MSAHRHARGRRLIPWTLALVVLIAAGVVGAVIGNSSSSPSVAVTAAAPSCNVTSVAEAQLPSVVTIMAGGGASGGVGSGEVIRPEGYILTNNHVIAPAVGGGSLEVLFDDGSTASATLVGRDPLTDLAVIRVRNKSGLRPIPTGNSAKLRIGQPVIALGAPLGLSSTVTSGIVSALDRTVNVPGEGQQSALLIDAVQTDAAINPGNSGGALTDCSGHLVGVPSAGATVPTPSGESSGGSIGLGFAIPVNLAKDVADEIIAKGRVTHAFHGLQAAPISVNATSQGGRAEGLRVSGIVPGSPAATAGLLVGDIITSIDGNPAVSNDQLMALTLTKRAGDRVELAYTRNGQHATATITLAEQP